jgi:hypothetical protein
MSRCGNPDCIDGMVSVNQGEALAECMACRRLWLEDRVTTLTARVAELETAADWDVVNALAVVNCAKAKIELLTGLVDAALATAKGCDWPELRDLRNWRKE